MMGSSGFTSAITVRAFLACVRECHRFDPNVTYPALFGGVTITTKTSAPVCCLVNSSRKGAPAKEPANDGFMGTKLTLGLSAASSSASGSVYAKTELVVQASSVPGCNRIAGAPDHDASISTFWSSEARCARAPVTATGVLMGDAIPNVTRSPFEIICAASAAERTF